MTEFDLSSFIKSDKEELEILRKTCIGFGKIEFTPLSENAVDIPTRRFLICRNKETIDFIDIELGLVWWKKKVDFNMSVHEGILNLAIMIIKNAEENTKRFGQDNFFSMYKKNNDVLHKFYEEVKAKKDPKNEKKDISKSDLSINKDFKSKIRYSCDLKAVA